MKLIKKIIQIWCPPTGIVLDPFAGSGTTAHAIMELNAESGADRRFLLIEQGRPERGDAYARTLTYERLKRAVTGERVNKKGISAISAAPLSSGFRFSKLTSQVDAAAVLALEREEMVDLLLTSYWDQKDRAAAHLRRLPAGTHSYLFAKSARGEGFFLIWNGPDQASVLTRDVNQIRAYYKADEHAIFITFVGGLLYWCRPTGPVELLDDRSHRRQTVEGWRNTSVNGTLLSADRLSGRLLKVQMFRGTICDVRAGDYLKRKLSDQLSPEVAAAEEAERALITAIVDLMRLLTWQDFELLVDLVFSTSVGAGLARSGARRRLLTWS